MPMLLKLLSSPLVVRFKRNLWAIEKITSTAAIIINTKGKRPSHVVVEPRYNEHIERAIKRFIKKCKKSGIADEFRKHQYYEKPSAKRRKEKLRREAVLKKLREKQDKQNT